MRISLLVPLAVLWCTASAAKKSAGSVFDTYFAKQAQTAPFVLDEAGYNELTAEPRDYSFVVLLTAYDAKYACDLCRSFAPEWDIIGRSWQKGDKKGEQRVLFGTVDFDRARNVFLKLQLQTAPVLLVFPPTVGENAKVDSQPLRFDFLGPQSAEGVYGWITRNTPAGDHPSLSRPINYSRIITTVTILIGLFTFATVSYPYILPVLQNRNLWAAISLILVLLFTSGHMFNHIRKVPYVSGNGRGGINYFAGGFSNQYGMETQIVAAMYAVLSFATIFLALRVPRMKDARAQQVSVIIWGGVVFGMYSFLMSVFRIKNGGYPFWLPPF